MAASPIPHVYMAASPIPHVCIAAAPHALMLCVQWCARVLHHGAVQLDGVGALRAEVGPILGCRLPGATRSGLGLGLGSKA